MDLTHCDGFDTMTVDNFCEKLTEKNALWSHLTSIIKPPLKCPLKAVYTYAS